MVEAAQVAGEVVSRSRVGLCDRAARQWKVTPGMRLHVPTVPLCASPDTTLTVLLRCPGEFRFSAGRFASRSVGQADEVEKLL